LSYRAGDFFPADLPKPSSLAAPIPSARSTNSFLQSLTPFHEAIVTEGDTWKKLRQNVKEVVKGF
jgi:hypothetical protein